MMDFGFTHEEGEAPEEDRRHRARLQIYAGLGVSAGAALLWLWIPSPLLILGLALAPAAFFLIFRLPYLAVLAFIGFSFFRLHEAFPILDSLHMPLYLALVSIAILVLQLMAGTLRPFWTRELTVLMLFAAHVTAGIAFATNRAVAMDYWIDNYSKIILMSLAIAWLPRNAQEIALAGKTFVMFGLIISVVALWNYSHGIDLVEGTRVTIGRDMGSLLGDPNDLALVLLFPLSFAATYLVSPEMTRAQRFFGAISSAIILLAILRTGSRGGLLGVVAVIAVFGTRIIKSRVALALLAIVSVMALFALAGISERSSGGASEAGIDESAQGRLYAWNAAYHMALDHPVMGIGMDNFRYNFFFYTVHWEGLAKAVHSTWFGVLAEAGFVGLALFLVLVGLTVRRSFLSVRALDRQRKAGAHVEPETYSMAQAVLAGLGSFIVSGSFLTQGFTWPIYILLAMAVSVTRFASATPETLPADAQENA